MLALFLGGCGGDEPRLPMTPTPIEPERPDGVSDRAVHSHGGLAAAVQSSATELVE